MHAIVRHGARGRRLAIGLALAALASLGACGSIGAERVIDEAEDAVALLPCAPEEPAACNALPRVVYFSVSARAYLHEAVRRLRRADHAQAEHFAIKARKAAEEALRLQEGR